VSLLNPYLKNGPKKGRKPIALGGKPNQPGHRAGPKRKRDVDEASSSQLTFAEAPSPPADEDFEAADGGFMSDGEHFIGGDDDSKIDDDEEDRKELVRQRMEEYLADIRNSTAVQTPY